MQHSTWSPWRKWKTNLVSEHNLAATCTGLVIAKTCRDSLLSVCRLRSDVDPSHGRYLQLLMSWCHLYAAGICVAAACSKRLTGLTREVWPTRTLSVQCWGELYLTPACTSSLWDSGLFWARCDNSLGSFLFSVFLKLGRYFTCQALCLLLSNK